MGDQKDTFYSQEENKILSRNQSKRESDKRHRQPKTPDTSRKYRKDKSSERVAKRQISSRKEIGKNPAERRPAMTRWKTTAYLEEEEEEERHTSNGMRTKVEDKQDKQIQGEPRHHQYNSIWRTEPHCNSPTATLCPPIILNIQTYLAMKCHRCILPNAAASIHDLFEDLLMPVSRWCFHVRFGSCWPSKWRFGAVSWWFTQGRKHLGLTTDLY